MRSTIFRLRDNLSGTIDIDLFDALEMSPHPLGVSPNDPDVVTFRDRSDGGGKIETIGQALYQALNGLPFTPLTKAIGDKMPIYVCEPSLKGQALPWETLSQNGDFLALDLDQRLARIVLTSEASAGAEHTFDRELRILAVLAAAGGNPEDPDANPLTAEDELKALIKGFEMLPSEIALKVQVIGCDKKVSDAVEVLQDRRFSFEFLPSAEGNQAFRFILAASEKLQPHVVHFFCHGQAGDPPRLELATRVDQENGSASGTVLLEPDDIAEILQKVPGVWLALLNCCLGAAPTPKSPGMARELVRDGFPAVVGMQEPIDRSDAHKFCSAFYDALRETLKAALAAPQPVEMDWPKLMIQPRRHLARSHVGADSQAKKTKTWTLPVLYVSRHPFALRILAPPALAAAPGLTTNAIAEVQAEISTLTALRDELAAAAVPASTLAKIDERIAQLRRSLSTPKSKEQRMPATLSLNAWTGEKTVSGAVGQRWQRWALGETGREVLKLLRPEDEPDWKDWRQPSVGWGVVLPEREGFSAADLAAGVDAPAPIRKLIAERGKQVTWKIPIFRYRGSAPSAERFSFLRNLAAASDLLAVGSGFGTDANKLPKYLLLVGSPSEIPWQLQYILSTQRGIGRLDLADENGLGRYVDALLSEWNGAAANPKRAVVWSVEHDTSDITALMRRLVAKKIHEQLVADNDIGEIGARFLDGKTNTEQATRGALTAALAGDRPALVVTTSHGRTGPLEDPVAMKAHLGLLVDQDFKDLDPTELLAAWQPDGAIWYSHACCSAGASERSSFAGLFEKGSAAEVLLTAIAKLGDVSAPLPRSLLAAEKPLRAFVGHVEPTFDWTLRNPENAQPLTDALQRSIYPGLFLGEPVGLAFNRWQQQAGGFNRLAQELRDRFNSGEELEKNDLFPRLAWRDVESTVILGDPTAVLPVERLG